MFWHEIYRCTELQLDALERMYWRFINYEQISHCTKKLSIELDTLNGKLKHHPRNQLHQIPLNSPAASLCNGQIFIGVWLACSVVSSLLPHRCSLSSISWLIAACNAAFNCSIFRLKCFHRLINLVTMASCILCISRLDAGHVMNTQTLIHSIAWKSNYIEVNPSKSNLRSNIMPQQSQCAKSFPSTNIA